jgi:hypothetical protein
VTPGQAFGIALIKRALLEEESSRTESYAHVPQTAQEQTYRIRNMFHDVQHQDSIASEPSRNVVKTSEGPAFDQEVAVSETVDQNRDRGKKPQVGYDSTDPSPTSTWDEHDAYRPWSGAIIDGSPGPAV